MEDYLVFKRFKTSLFEPNNLAGLVNDSSLMTFLYYVLLLILSIIPAFILIFSSLGLSYDEKLSIRNDFKGVEIPYEIVDYQLVKKVNDENNYHKYKVNETFYVIFTDSKIEDLKYQVFFETVIIFTKDRVVYEELLYNRMELLYKDNLNLKELDFAGATNNELEFWDTVFAIVNSILEQNSSKYKIVNAFAMIIYANILLILYSLIITLFQYFKVKHIVSFGKFWKVAIYAMTPFVLLTLFGDLFNFQVLSIIGIIISYFYSSNAAYNILKNNNY